MSDFLDILTHGRRLQGAVKELSIEELEQVQEKLSGIIEKRKEKLVEQKWDKQLDILLAQMEDHLQKDNKLEEIRIIIQNREPLLQEQGDVGRRGHPHRRGGFQRPEPLPGRVASDHHGVVLSPRLGTVDQHDPQLRGDRVLLSHRPRHSHGDLGLRPVE